MKKILLSLAVAAFCLTAMPQTVFAAGNQSVGSHDVEYKHWSKRLQKWQYLSCKVQNNEVQPSTCKVVSK